MNIKEQFLKHLKEYPFGEILRAEIKLSTGVTLATLSVNYSKKQYKRFLKNIDFTLYGVGVNFIVDYKNGIVRFIHDFAD